MSKFLIAAVAGAMLIGAGAANAQSQSQPAATQGQQTMPTNDEIIINRAPPAVGTVGSSRATYPPEGQEGTKRPGQTAPKGNPAAPPVTR